RALEERRSRGEDGEEAFENALRDLGLEIPGEESESADEPWADDEQEPWADEGPESFGGEAGPEDEGFGDGDEKGDPFGPEDDERHPLLRRAMDILKHLHTVFRDADPQHESSLRTLFQGAGDAMGGLAQALSRRIFDEDDPGDYGLRV